MALACESATRQPTRHKQRTASLPIVPPEASYLACELQHGSLQDASNTQQVFVQDGEAQVLTEHCAATRMGSGNLRYVYVTVVLILFLFIGT